MTQNLTGPPTPTPRVPVNVLVRPSARDWLDQTAHHHHLTRSDVIRACMAVAKKHDKDLVATLQSMGETS